MYTVWYYCSDNQKTVEKEKKESVFDVFTKQISEMGLFTLHNNYVLSALDDLKS